MIHNLLVTKLAQSLKIDAITEGLPFEVEEVRRVRLLPARVVEQLSLIGSIVCHLGPGPLITRRLSRRRLQLR